MSQSPFAIPTPSTSFVAQRKLLRAMADAHAHGARLLALRGPPGVGKTRVALEWARVRATELGVAATWVELASARSAESIAIALGGALQGKLRAEKSEEMLLEVRAMVHTCGPHLLVLDGADLVLEVLRNTVPGLLAANPSLTVVVTARAMMGVDGERAFEVQPLSVPPPGTATDSLARYDAVTLLAHRTTALRGESAMGGDALVHMADIARRVDGLPLAMELAIARLPVASLAQIAQLLARPLDLLVGRAGVVGLRTSIEHSWAQLGALERAQFARLSLFRSSFDLETATRLWAGNEKDPDLRRIRCLDGLQSLVDRSLVQSEGTDAPRFRVLSPVREFAYEQLVASGDEVPASRAFVDAVLEQCEPLGPAAGEHPPSMLALEREEGNVRAAIEYAQRREMTFEGLRGLLVLGALYARRARAIHTPPPEAEAPHAR